MAKTIPTDDLTTAVRRLALVVIYGHEVVFRVLPQPELHGLCHAVLDRMLADARVVLDLLDPPEPDGYPVAPKPKRGRPRREKPAPVAAVVGLNLATAPADAANGEG